MLQSLANPVGGFLPHGYCIAWQPELVFALVAGNLIVAASYYSIPVALLWFRHRNPDLRYGWLASIFGAFIFACGTTHVIDVINLWRPLYRLDAAMMLLTAAISATTAVSLWFVIPRVNEMLRFNIRARKELAELNAQLEQTVRSLQLRTEELQRSEQRFRLMFRQSPIGMALVELDGRFKQANEALCRLLDYPEDQLQRMDFQRVTHPGDLGADLQNIAALLEGRRECYQMEKRYIASGGREVDVQLDVGLMRDSEGRPLHFIAQIQDIGSRRQLERERRRAEDEMRRLLEHLNTGVVVHDPDTRVRYANPVALEILCLTSEQIMGLAAVEEHWQFLRPDGTVMPVDDFPVNRVRATRMPLYGCEVGVVTAAGGPPVWMLVYGFPELDANGKVVRFIMSFNDISERRRLLNELDRLARHDPLTGLPNRRHFLEQAERELRRASRSGMPLALLMLDLDHFKRINDRHGHAAGDEVLRATARMLGRELRTQDTAARWGGEEFVVLAPDTSLDAATDLAERIRQKLREFPIELPDGGSLQVSASIGVGILGESPMSRDLESLLRHADAALYQAKTLGRDRVSTGLTTA